MITQLVVYYIIPILKKYKTIAIDLSKQQTLDTRPKPTCKVKLESATMFFVIENSKETILDFSWKAKSIAVLFFFNIILV